MSDKKMVRVGGVVTTTARATVYRTEGYGKTPSYLIESLARRAIRDQCGFSMVSLGGFRVTYKSTKGIKS